MRSLASLVASLLGLLAVCLVVFGTTQKQLQIGVLLGLWAGLIAAFLMVGPRRSQAEQAARLAEAEQRARELHEAQLQVSQFQQAQLAAAEEARGRHEVELRKLGEVQLSREAASRRESDLQLELSLRREIQRMMNEQIGMLRNEVAALRAEVVDKLGGQLRLERIETTRLIGSDLEALQHEIRRLAGQESIGAGPAQLTAGVSRLSVDPGDVVEHHGRRERIEPRDPGQQPAWSEPTVVSSESQAPAASRPAEPPPSDPFDLIAGLPRLSPLPADIELIQDSPWQPAGAAESRRPAADQAAAGYHGRRRATDEDGEEPAAGGGRRRAPDDAPDDLLTRLRRS